MGPFAPAHAGRSLAGVVLAVLVAVVAVACDTPERAAPPSGDRPAAVAEWPPVGEVTTLPGGRIRATGIVARHALDVHGGTTFYWALYADTGSSTSAPSVIAALDPDDRALLRSVEATSQQAALARLDGKIVTVEGALGSRGMRIDYERLSADEVTVAPPAVQMGVDWSDSLVRPGKWFEDEPRRLLFYAFESLKRPGLDSVSFSDPHDADRLIAGPVKAPTYPRVGRPVGMRVEMEKRREHRRWTLVMGGGFDLSSVPYSVEPDYPGIVSRGRERAGKWISLVPYSLARIGRRHGIVIYSFGGGTRYANGIEWWDGEAVHRLWYWGPFRKAPTAGQFVAMARSMEPLD